MWYAIISEDIENSLEKRASARPAHLGRLHQLRDDGHHHVTDEVYPCLLYTSPSPRDGLLSRMPSSA